MDERDKETQRCLDSIREDEEREHTFLATSSPKQILQNLWVYSARMIAIMKEVQTREKAQPAQFWARLKDLEKVQRYLLHLDMKMTFIDDLQE